jgi:hypothetical protein
MRPVLASIFRDGSLVHLAGRFGLLGRVRTRLSRRVGAGFHGSGRGGPGSSGRVDLLVSRGPGGCRAVRSRP